MISLLKYIFCLINHVTNAYVNRKRFHDHELSLFSKISFAHSICSQNYVNYNILVNSEMEYEGERTF